jgi:hypothetical protein
MGVQTVKKDPSSHSGASDFVRVESHVAPDDDTVTLVTIQRLVDINYGVERSVPAWRVKTLLRECPMSPAQAVGLAAQYARRKGIPLVLAGQD